MRVIAGKCRSLPLRALAGNETRPTTDRIKETLFNILQPEIPGCRFLDLFAGSGAIGIEALSRGASFAAFAEKNPKACEVIKSNLGFTKLEDDAKLLPVDVLSAVKILNGDPPFGVIFMDPPYDLLIEDQVLSALKGSSLCDADSLIVIEAALGRDFSFAQELGFSIIREKRYKTNKHVFLRLP